MIKITGGDIQVIGKKAEIQQEFMLLAQAIREKGIFSDNEEMLDAVKFAISDSKEQKEILYKLMEEAFKRMFEEGEK